MTTLEELTRVDGAPANIRGIESHLNALRQTIARAGDELAKVNAERRVAQADLYLWKQMAAWLVKHVQGVSDQDCKLIAAYESLKEKTK